LNEKPKTKTFKEGTMSEKEVEDMMENKRHSVQV